MYQVWLNEAWFFQQTKKNAGKIINVLTGFVDYPIFYGSKSETATHSSVAYDHPGKVPEWAKKKIKQFFMNEESGAFRNPGIDYRAYDPKIHGKTFCPHCGTDVSYDEETEYGIACHECRGDFWRSETIPEKDIKHYKQYGDFMLDTRQIKAGGPRRNPSRPLPRGKTPWGLIIAGGLTVAGITLVIKSRKKTTPVSIPYRAPAGTAPAGTAPTQATSGPSQYPTIVINNITSDKVQKTMDEIKAKGGIVTKNSFSTSGVSGSYAYNGNTLTLVIFDKPWIATKGQVESKIREYFA